MSDEKIEDYCIRSAVIHPWSLEAGTKIKTLQAEVERLTTKEYRHSNLELEAEVERLREAMRLALKELNYVNMYLVIDKALGGK